MADNRVAPPGGGNKLREGAGPGPLGRHAIPWASSLEPKWLQACLRPRVTIGQGDGKFLCPKEGQWERGALADVGCVLVCIAFK